MLAAKSSLRAELVYIRNRELIPSIPCLGQFETLPRINFVLDKRPTGIHIIFRIVGEACDNGGLFSFTCEPHVMPSFGACQTRLPGSTL
jgi:hypothetical protein